MRDDCCRVSRDGVEPAASDFAFSHLQALLRPSTRRACLPFADAANDARIADLYENILSKANVKSIMYVAISVGDDVPAAFALSTTKAHEAMDRSRHRIG